MTHTHSRGSGTSSAQPIQVPRPRLELSSLQLNKSAYQRQDHVDLWIGHGAMSIITTTTTTLMTIPWLIRPLRFWPRNWKEIGPSETNQCWRLNKTKGKYWSPTTRGNCTRSSMLQNTTNTTSTTVSTDTLLFVCYGRLGYVHNTMTYPVGVSSWLN